MSEPINFEKESRQFIECFTTSGITEAFKLEEIMRSQAARVEEETIQRCRPFGGTGMDMLPRLYATESKTEGEKSANDCNL